MNLTETLEARVALGRNKIPTTILEIMDSATERLIDKQISKKALSEGSTFPSFNLSNINGKELTLEEIKGSKATIISFYRGGWCPYCNIELQALEKELASFKTLGASLIAITPETPDNSLTTAEKNEITFEVLSDINNGLGKEVGLVFELSKDLQKVYAEKFNIDLEKHNQNTSGELPMAATYVIDDRNVIKYAFVTEDYTKRAAINEIKEVLKKL